MKKCSICCYFLFLLLSLSSTALSDYSGDPAASLFQDLLVVDYWNKRINERMPVTYDHYLNGGYFNMPSARMGDEGEVGVGYSSVPPYRNYNLRMQLTGHLEISGNYRVFRGVEDPILSPFGFGDLSDKGANIKLAICRPEDTDYKLPGLAIGFQDFMGTKSFNAQYVVVTHVFLDESFEVSLGYGRHRIKGLFGGCLWMPFRKSCWTYLQGLSIAAEYDAVPYRDEQIEKHPKGRDKKSPINFGFKYRLWDCYDFSLSYVRGHALAFSASTFYNFGTTKGFVPKINDPLPYQAPVDVEPLGLRRPEEMMAQELNYAFRDQGFELLKCSVGYDEYSDKVLRIDVTNQSYRLEKDVREQFNHLMAALIPEDIDRVIIAMYSEGFPVQEYHYEMEYVRCYAAKEMGPYELDVLTPLTEYTPPCCDENVVFDKPRDLWNVECLPRTHTFFGSSTGKFKYCLGINFGLNGYFFRDYFYSVLLGCTFFSKLGQLTGVDRLNPSQLINVRTDIIRYYKQRGITFDEAYIQRNWNMGKGWYSKCALGLFEEEYGGIATQFLYYPLKNDWAVGVEGAVLRKRTVKGLGFTNKIRKLDGFRVTHRHFLGSQYFLDLFYDWRKTQLAFKVQIGKFLANDWGVRYEMSRKFESGLRITIWYTITNGHDRINGHTYHDKGVAFTMPLDIFYTSTDRTMWNYGMSAWLRDVGVTAYTGKELYQMINDERQGFVP